MADNTAQNGTALIATDGVVTRNGATVPEVQFQVVKVAFGTDGVARDIDAANGLPVVGTFFQATQPISIAASVAVTGPLTDTQIRATSLPVSGAFFQASQPVSLATNTPDITDRAGRLLGSIANTGFTVTGNSLVSTANSSATALAAGGLFTGTAEDVSEYSTVMVNVFSDQASATDGLSIQQSSNGTNWDVTDVYSIPINSGKIFSIGVGAKFFRVVYTNGATASTAMRLQTIFSKESKKNSSQRPQDGRTNDNDMEEVLGFGMVYNGTSWDRLRGTAATGMTVNGTFFQATQPVSLATNTPTLATGANVIGSLVANQSVITSDIRAATLHVTATAAVNTAITASLPAPAAGLFHYITSVQLVKVYNALGVAAGAGVVITSSNLPGSPAWLTEQAAGAVGTAVRVIDYQPTTPLKATLAATATTFVAPAQLQTIWRWNVSYFTAA